MRADATHPDQVRHYLEAAAQACSSALERDLIERCHAEAMSLVEDEWRATQTAWDQWIEEEQGAGDVGRQAPTSDDEVGI